MGTIKLNNTKNVFTPKLTQFLDELQNIGVKHGSNGVYIDLYHPSIKGINSVYLDLTVRGETDGLKLNVHERIGDEAIQTPTT